MKKSIVSITAAMLFFFAISVQAKEVNPAPRSATETSLTESAIVETLVARVNEIKAMDKSSMSPTEKKELRKELRSLKKSANAHSQNGVVYISGSLVLVIILLIILL
jgi:hypothetical protein